MSVKLTMPSLQRYIAAIAGFGHVARTEALLRRLPLHPGTTLVRFESFVMPTRIVPASLAVVLTSLLAPLGCADARGRFEDFQNRLGSVPDAGLDADDSGDAGDSVPCVPPAPNAVGGPALLALDTNLIPGKPILFLGTIDTPAENGTTAVHFAYHALDAHDRHTLVGPALEVGPYELDAGLLTAPVAKSELDGRANPQLYGTPITSEMTLVGEICGVRTFYCGTLQGDTSGLVNGPFTGHFGITLLSGPDAVPDRPRFGCDPNALADPLAPGGPQP